MDIKPTPEGPYNLDNYKVEDSVGYLIKRLRTAMTGSMDRELAVYDVSYDQWGVIVMLGRKMGDTAAELSREMGCDTGSMTRMIDRLEAKGLIRRARCSDDRRVVRLALTDSGRELVEAMPAVLVPLLNRMLRGFSEEEFNQLKQYLRRMLDNLEQERT